MTLAVLAPQSPAAPSPSKADGLAAGAEADSIDLARPGGHRPSATGRSPLDSPGRTPWAVPEVVAATTWAWMMHTDFGIINYMLTSADVVPKPIGWLTGKDTVMPALIAVNVWKLFPFVAIMVLAGMVMGPDFTPEKLPVMISNDGK